ncbi:LamB/YcsF family protein [Propioniferax innocua]|nr:5-oxoprolinase subunit PxpA [Propioniferax innocua]
MPTSIDLNADLGESFGQWSMGDDAAMLDVVSSANIACGFHAGDPMVMRRTVTAAAERGVAIGAHVSYNDLAGFGRRSMDIAPGELEADVLYQIAALDGVARAHGTRVTYVKPHGALYNRIVRDDEQAQAVVRAVRAFNPELAVLGLPGSRFLVRADAAGLRTVTEAFADRAYNADGTLVSRSRPGAVLDDPQVVAERMIGLVRNGHIEAVTGELVRVDADSICTHGDSPGAVAMAKAVHSALRDAGITIGAFAGQHSTEPQER